MDKAQLITYEKERNALLAKAEERIEALPYAYDTATIIDVTEDGIELETTYRHCGSCDTDYDQFILSWEELEMEVADFVIQYNKRIAAQQKAKKELEEKAKRKEREAAALRKEKADRETYERLKEKFGK